MNDKNCRGEKLQVFCKNQQFNFPAISFFYSARVLGFEPRSKVLETRMLPLHHTRIKKAISRNVLRQQI